MTRRNQVERSAAMHIDKGKPGLHLRLIFAVHPVIYASSRNIRNIRSQILEFSKRTNIFIGLVGLINYSCAFLQATPETI